jgi:2'-5' RNA ligase
MAQKQAELRNEAERLGLQMHADGYSQAKLFEAVTLMQKAEESIKGNRYENAVNYQQQAAEALNTAKVMADGQMHVTLDTTPQASGKVRKDMEDAMNGAMPKGYADPVKAYFERLSQPGN